MPRSLVEVRDFSKERTVSIFRVENIISKEQDTGRKMNDWSLFYAHCLSYFPPWRWRPYVPSKRLIPPDITSSYPRSHRCENLKKKKNTGPLMHLQRSRWKPCVPSTLLQKNEATAVPRTEMRKFPVLHLNHDVSIAARVRNGRLMNHMLILNRAKLFSIA
jgi:hypothetical protein